MNGGPDAIRPGEDEGLPLGPERWAPGAAPDPLGGRGGPIGAPVSRLDGPLRVTGGARFAAEVPLPGMTFAALAYSTIARGRIVSLETEASEEAPGVALVMTHLNAPIMNAPPALTTAEKGGAGSGLSVMQGDRIRWNGEPIALVLAETQEQADYASSLIRVIYEEEPAATSFKREKDTAPPAEPFQGTSLNHDAGDAEGALAAAAYRVDAVYSTPYHSHNAIEPHAATVAWDGDELFLHDSTQVVTHAAWSLSQVFGIEEDRVHVSSPYVGGGFGGKTLWAHQILAVAAAKLIGRPVRITLSREGVYRIVGGRGATEQRVAIGADPDGRFTALIHAGVAAKARPSVVPEPFIYPSRYLYAAPNRKFDVRIAHLDLPSNTYMRAPGKAVGTFALESAVDELAEQLEIDPVELRIRNEPDLDPTFGKPFSSRHLIEAFRAGAERFGWDSRVAQPRARREGEWLIGMGCASATYPYHRIPGVAMRLTLTDDGHAKVEVAAQDMGMGTETVQTQIAAARLGLPLERVDFSYGTSSLPGVVLGAGSHQTVAIGAAGVAAQRKLVAELLAIVPPDSPLAGLELDQVAVTEGALCKIGEPDLRQSYVEILRTAGLSSLSAEDSGPPPEEWLEHWSIHSFGAQFCEVRVNAVTGELRVTRFLGSFDCGRILNPKTAASQLRGGIVMGLGMALMEETLFDDRHGRIINPSLSEYYIPVHLDVPEIEVLNTDIPDPHTPMGIRGAIGEIGITGVAAAVANAAYNATGIRVRDLPITLDKLVKLSASESHPPPVLAVSGVTARLGDA